MKVIDIREAEIHLARLVDKAANGEPFIIAKAGRPVAQVTAVEAAPKLKPRRLGFLAGVVFAPADFDCMNQAEIENLFGTHGPSRDTIR